MLSLRRRRAKKSPYLQALQGGYEAARGALRTPHTPGGMDSRFHTWFCVSYSVAFGPLSFCAPIQPRDARSVNDSGAAGIHFV